MAAIAAPTLVVGGSHDTATPLEHARELANSVPHASLKIIACGHLAVEQPPALQAALGAHVVRASAGGRQDWRTPRGSRARQSAIDGRSG
ncbi:alpha/beta fold hydrolase [Streptomyces sp. ME18-1-4]|uniref:alpha/beta fold hydrolase n=1 Tax=Streptomyces sp. ME18-1-4 TaxID=3028685 RepID=UPI0039F6895C